MRGDLKAFYGIEQGTAAKGPAEHPNDIESTHTPPTQKQVSHQSFGLLAHLTWFCCNTAVRTVYNEQFESGLCAVSFQMTCHSGLWAVAFGDATNCCTRPFSQKNRSRVNWDLECTFDFSTASGKGIAYHSAHGHYAWWECIAKRMAKAVSRPIFLLSIGR